MLFAFLACVQVLTAADVSKRHQLGTRLALSPTPVDNGRSRDLFVQETMQHKHRLVCYIQLAMSGWIGCREGVYFQSPRLLQHHQLVLIIIGIS